MQIIQFEIILLVSFVIRVFYDVINAIILLNVLYVQQIYFYQIQEIIVWQIAKQVILFYFLLLDKN